MSKITRFINRNRLSIRKALWRLRHNYAPNAKACYVLGVQRSGTTLILDCLEQSPEIEVLGEESKATVNNRLKSDEEVRRLITSSHHRVIVFKPIIESHRGSELLKLSPNSAALWVFRRVEDRANSAVAKFGETNLKLLRAFSRGAKFDAWQAQGLTEENLALIRTFDYSNMSPQSAAAIFWYIRNSLYFSGGLDKFGNVLPLAYEDLVFQPEKIMRGICRYLGCEYFDDMIRNIHSKSVGRDPSCLDEQIANLCSPMYEKLQDLQEQHWSELKLFG